MEVESERVKNGVLEVGVIALGLKAYIIVLKLFRVNYKIN